MDEDWHCFKGEWQRYVATLHEAAGETLPDRLLLTNLQSKLGEVPQAQLHAAWEKIPPLRMPSSGKNLGVLTVGICMTDIYVSGRVCLSLT